MDMPRTSPKQRTRKKRSRHFCFFPPLRGFLTEVGEFPLSLFAIPAYHTASVVGAFTILLLLNTPGMVLLTITFRQINALCSSISLSDTWNDTGSNPYHFVGANTLWLDDCFSNSSLHKKHIEGIVRACCCVRNFNTELQDQHGCGWEKGIG